MGIGRTGDRTLGRAAMSVAIRIAAIGALCAATVALSGC
ncbi:hypothetical protein BURCENBC7_AP7649, partial [Burkholderia cenocepacia BC7]